MTRDAASPVVTLRGVDGTRTVLGRDYAAGIVAEGVTLVADEWGPQTCSFTLRRDPTVSWGDLTAANQVEVEVDGVVVWGGRINQTPGSGRNTTAQIQVSAQGWQAHLDDDQLDEIWVMDRVERYADQRTFNPAATLTTYRADAGVETGGGSVILQFPHNFVVVTNDAAAVTLDLGPTARYNRAVVAWERIGAADANKTVLSRGNSTIDASTAADGASSTLASASGTLAFTCASPRRYHHILLVHTGAGGTITGPQGVRITAMRLFAETAYESGNNSVLNADNVVTDVLASGALPLLSSATGLVEATAFNIPEFAPDGYRTPREILQAINAYHDYLVGVTADRRLYFKARPSTPLYEVGAWSGDSFSDVSAGNLDDLYNKVIVEYTAGDGSIGREVRTSSSSILTAQGFTRTARFQVNAMLTAAAAQQIGDVWLTRRDTSPLKGSITVAYGDVRTVDTGATVHPSVLLTKTGELLRLSDRADPGTGGWSRDGVIVGVTYNADTETATVTLDNDNRRFDALLARLGALQSTR